ncbi:MULTISPECIES: diacylglycerol kinase family protein [Caproicibacterium]|uniref:Diacylglycerol kinase family protein n=1 Tax=Caproicibacterium argilliputei TaxID=3030016 RepID=A0AA97DAG1_9FIRM|nr:diacylglycerol kinase family protein [Caproicibacterium argilliputei]WOC32422.1 diacylglycerol kinase family protein [Caproicibacterium argilliputei]
MRFLKSLKYALRGIVYSINTERNMRFHTVAAFYTLLFSPFFHLGRLGYAVLFLTIGSVVSAEMVNTVVETQCDLVSTTFSSGIRGVKDLAAGGVLVRAFCAVGVALCLFAKPAYIAAGWRWLTDRPWLLALLAVSAVLSAVYVSIGPPGIRDRLHALFCRHR